MTYIKKTLFQIPYKIATNKESIVYKNLMEYRDAFRSYNDPTSVSYFNNHISRRVGMYKDIRLLIDNTSEVKRFNLHPEIATYNNQLVYIIIYNTINRILEGYINKDMFDMYGDLQPRQPGFVKIVKRLVKSEKNIHFVSSEEIQKFIAKFKIELDDYTPEVQKKYSSEFLVQTRKQLKLHATE